MSQYFLRKGTQTFNMYVISFVNDRSVMLNHGTFDYFQDLAAFNANC